MKKTRKMRMLAASTATVLVVTSFSAIPVAAENTIATNYSNPKEWVGRHSVDDINHMMADLEKNYPAYAELGSLGKTGNNREQTLLTITDESVPAEEKTGIGVFGNIHGGERESGESAAFTAAWLLENQNDPAVRAILQKHIVYVVPLLNPDGYYYSDWYYVRGTSVPLDKNGDGVPSNDWYEDITGDEWIGYIYASNGENPDNPRSTYIGDVGYEALDRDKNGWMGDDHWFSGTDINRNFDYEWDPSHADVGGPSAASEIETRNIQDFLAKTQLDALTTLHTGIQTVLYPWCSRPADESNAEEMAEINFMKDTAEKMRKAIEETTQRNYYAMSSYDDYQTYSELTDYAFGKHGIHTYTIEVYRPGTGKNSQYDPEHPNDSSYCYWNEEYPSSKNDYYSYDDFTAILKSKGLDPATIKVKDKADGTEKTLEEMHPAGFYVNASAGNNARCHHVPEDQDMMVAGAKDAILQMIYAEGKVVDPEAVDKTQLAAAIAEAEALAPKKDTYTTKTYAALETALKKAKDIYQVSLYQQEAIDKAAADLKAAIKNLAAKAAKWMQDENGWRYTYGNDDFATNCRETIDGAVYAFDSKGYRITEWANIDNKWSYHSADGKAITGWNVLGGKWYYFDEKGIMKDGWMKLNNNWYYLGEANDGAMRDGWQLLGGKWYYFGEPSDGAMKHGWQLLGSKWYYLGDADDGAMKDGWQLIGGKWYYLGEGDGTMRYGWQLLGSKWYYLGDAGDGAMKDGWIKLGSDWYYLNSDGAMLSGWQKINNDWYYLGSADDGRMYYGTHTIDGTKYDFGGRDDGRMK